jgi:hypothetical protein
MCLNKKPPLGSGGLFLTMPLLCQYSPGRARLASRIPLRSIARQKSDTDKGNENCATAATAHAENTTCALIHHGWFP